MIVRQNRSTTAPLSPNQRAVTVKVDTASGVAPGNRVDVVLFMNKGDWAKYPLAKILFQNLEVLNTDQKQQVTLAVTPQEAVDLTWAAQVGRHFAGASGPERHNYRTANSGGGCRPVFGGFWQRE